MVAFVAAVAMSKESKSADQYEYDLVHEFAPLAFAYLPFGRAGRFLFPGWLPRVSRSGASSQRLRVCPT